MTEKETKEKKVSEKPSSFEVPKHIKLEFAIIGAVLVLAAGLVMGSVWFPHSTAEVVIGDNTVNTSMNTGTLSTKVLDYVNTNLIPDGATATVTNIESAGDSLYAVTIDVTLDGQTQPGTVYVTETGDRILLGSVLDTAVALEQPASEPEPVVELQKSDKPTVELFVMSHCPYGTQMEKGLIPVVETLGDKIDFEMRFVYYTMHGLTEMQEELKQYCIEEEQNDKYLPYLKCFLKAGETDTCLAEAEIDTAAMETCVLDADNEFQITANYLDTTKYLSGKYPLFGIDAEKNTEYGVGGSPTLVVNGTTVNSARTSASLLQTICGAFNEQPEECTLELSSVSPSAGFGYEEGTGTDATCG
ncbi:MAG: hypothetical protein V1672_00355 [Candidatus Diapherotrites archaeon]